MEQNDVTLKIIITYNNSSKELTLKEIITYEELKEKAIELFNINENKKDLLEFTYLDEDGDLNILCSDKDELINAAKEINYENYLLELKLSIIEIDNFNDFFEIKNDNNIINEENNNDYNNDNNDERHIENLNMEQIEKIKRNFKKELHKVYKNKIEEIKYKFNELINEKFNSIENEIEKISYTKNNNNYITININEIGKSANIKNIKIDDIKNNTLTIFENNEFIIVYKNGGEIRDKNEFQNNLIKIKEKIKSAYKKGTTNEDFIKYGDDIYDIMNKGKDKIEINDINEYFKNYLSPKEKENDRLGLIKTLGKIYKYLEIKKINQINLNFFKKEKPKENKDDFLINEEEDDKNYKDLLDELVDNSNKFKQELIHNLNNYTNNK